jgi:uncharacterized protein (TIGR02001 family)
VARRRRLARLAVVATLLAPAWPAAAQVSGAVAIQSDDIWQGLSLGLGYPALSASLAYDDKSGLYAGATGILTDTRRFGVEPLGFIVDAGFAGRADKGTAYDVGAIDAQVYAYFDSRLSFNYAGLYGGLGRGDVGAHVFVYPDYPLTGRPAVYVDLSASHRLDARWRVFGHLGVDTWIAPGSSVHARLDAQAGVARRLGDVELQLMWVGVTSPLIYPDLTRQPTNEAVAAASLSF